MSAEPGLFHVQRAGEVGPGIPAGWADHVERFQVTTLVGRHVGAVHTGWELCTLRPSGQVDLHVHSFEQSFYVLAGNPQLTVDGRSYLISPDECGLLPVGVPHAWRNGAGEEARWLEVSSPAPRPTGPVETFWTGGAPEGGQVSPPDIRDPRTRSLFALRATDMDLDSLKIGAAVDAPTVSASMATALLAYSGIAVKMLVDQRLGAVLHQMFMVEYQPGGVAQPHDHPFEETYYVLDGQVDARAEGEEFSLRPGDVFWTGVGCVHAFYHRGSGRVRFLETQSPQPPSNYSYRFTRDWDYLAAQLDQRTAGES
jgi:quercetin dioxygenase-like cupin family protein